MTGPDWDKPYTPPTYIKPGIRRPDVYAPQNPEGDPGNNPGNDRADLIAFFAVFLVVLLVLIGAGWAAGLAFVAAVMFGGIAARLAEYLVSKRDQK